MVDYQPCSVKGDSTTIISAERYKQLDEIAKQKINKNAARSSFDFPYN